MTAGQHDTVWLTGLSGAGKSSIADALARQLKAQGRTVALLDGDQLRHGMNRDLGFTPEDRHENIRRAAEVARLMNAAGLIVIAAFISPYRADRAMAAAIIGAAHFIEVHVSTPLAECEARDPKGLYAKARAGELRGFTGLDDPYETPSNPDLRLDMGMLGLDEACESIEMLVASKQRA